MIGAVDQTFHFGEFELSGAKRSLRRRGDPIALSSKPFELLLALVENHGQIVTKDELLERVWKDQFVEDNNLSVQISLLRKLLGEERNGTQFITTISGAGYKFVAAVTTVSASTGPDSLVSETALATYRREGRESSIVGRERELAEIDDLLENDDVRLLTLTGAGGCGKTALAREIADSVAVNFPDGVLFVELAAATEKDLVLSTLAQALEIDKSDETRLVAAIKETLQSRRVLLILDNFEQVLSAAPFIGELLSELAQIKMIVTSRVALRLPCEYVLPVQPLQVPAANELVSVETSDAFPSISLFRIRAEKARPGFVLTTANINAVAEICRHLDGLPLAIELAAVRVKLFSPEAMLDRLAKSLNFLTGGTAHAPERQRTMRDAIRWSYDLLDDNERLIFRGLAVFSGGFSVECAEALAGCRNADILNLLSSLIDNQLLVSRDISDGNVRLQMLEVIREFAFEVLEETGELAEVQREHANYFLVLAEEAEALLHGEQSGRWMRKLELEHGNLRAALRWALEHDGQVAARIASALRFFWSSHGHLSEGLSWSRAALRMTENTISSGRAKLLLSNGLFLRHHGNLAAARELYEKCLVESRELEDVEQINKAYQGLGSIAVLAKDFVSARQFYNESLAMSRQINDQAQLTYVLGALGDLEMCEGNFAAAREFLYESLNLADKSSNHRVLTVVYFNLGTIDYFERLTESAYANFVESLRIAVKLGYKTMIACALEGFAGCAAAAGDYATAALLAGATDTLRDEIGYETEPAEEVFRNDYLSKTRGAMSDTAFERLYFEGKNLRSGAAAALALGREQNRGEEIGDDAFREFVMETHEFKRITIDEEFDS